MASFFNPVATLFKTKSMAQFFLPAKRNGRVALVAAFESADVEVSGEQNHPRRLSPLVGGKGGGRPENAQGAGTDASKINQALDRRKRFSWVSGDALWTCNWRQDRIR